MSLLSTARPFATSSHHTRGLALSSHIPLRHGNRGRADPPVAISTVSPRPVAGRRRAWVGPASGRWFWRSWSPPCFCVSVVQLRCDVKSLWHLDYINAPHPPHQGSPMGAIRWGCNRPLGRRFSTRRLTRGHPPNPPAARSKLLPLARAWTGRPNTMGEPPIKHSGVSTLRDKRAVSLKKTPSFWRAVVMRCSQPVSRKWRESISGSSVATRCVFRPVISGQTAFSTAECIMKFSRRRVCSWPLARREQLYGYAAAALHGDR